MLVQPGAYRDRRCRVRWRLASLLLAGALAARPHPGSAQSVEELRNLSLEQLAEVQVSSVSKSAEPLSDAPAAIFVISHDDIIRSGATTIPEMLAAGAQSERRPAQRRRPMPFRRAASTSATMRACRTSCWS